MSERHKGSGNEREVSMKANEAITAATYASEYQTILTSIEMLEESVDKLVDRGVRDDDPRLKRKREQLESLYDQENGIRQNLKK